MLDRLRALWATEPTRLIALLVAVVVFAAAKAGIVVDAQGVGDALLIIVPIVLGGEITRARVSPAAGPVGPDSDDLLPDLPPDA